MGLLLKYSMRNLWRSKKSSLMVMILLVCAVVAFIVFPMRGKSALRKMKSYGFEDRVLVMEKDNLKLAFSRVDEELHQFVRTAPYVAMEGDDPLVSPYLQMSSTFGNKFLMLRGITDMFYRVRGPTFKIIEGRNLEDKYDILIGHLVPRRLGKPYKVGDVISLEGRDWKIVGVFMAEKDPAEAGALVRMEDFREVSARETYSFIEIKADSTEHVRRLMRYVNMAFEALHDEFPDAPAIMALPEKQYWSKLAGMFKMAVMVSRVRAAAVIICVLLFVMNIYHSKLMKRKDEIRVLTYNGVSRFRIFCGILLEAFVVSVVAGAIGGLIAMAFSGTAMNLQWSTVILNIGYSVLPGGLILAITVGILAIIPPAVKLVRIS